MLPEDQKRILGYFIEEAKDHLNTIEQGVLNLDATIHDSEMVNEVFRAAHSVKGGAAMLGIGSMQRTAHRMEDFFKVMKESPLTPDQALESMLLQIFDGLQEQLDHLQSPYGLSDEQGQAIIANLEPVFAQAEAHLASLSSGSAAAPAAAPPPTKAPAAAKPDSATETSALQLVFRSDIPALLRDMLAAFKQADNDESRQQLAQLCQRLRRFGEQLDVPQWCDLVHTVEQAVGNRNETYRALAPVVIKDLKQAQDQVLAGQVSQVVASAALLALQPPAVEDEADLDALLAEALTEATDSEDLADLFATAEADAGASLTMDEDDSWLDQLTNTEAEAFDDGGLEAVFGNLDGETPAAPTPATDTLGGQHHPGIGPQVGSEELNSLADLFEGEQIDLGGLWEETDLGEGSLGDADSEPSADDIDSEFADLFQTKSAPAPAADHADDDMASLFGDALDRSLGPDTEAWATEPAAEPAPEAEIPAVEPPVDMDLFDHPAAAPASASAAPAAPQAVPDDMDEFFGSGAPTPQIIRPAVGDVDDFFSEVAVPVVHRPVAAAPPKDKAPTPPVTATAAPRVSPPPAPAKAAAAQEAIPAPPPQPAEPERPPADPDLDLLFDQLNPAIADEAAPAATTDDDLIVADDLGFPLEDTQAPSDLEDLTLGLASITLAPASLEADLTSTEGFDLDLDFDNDLDLNATLDFDLHGDASPATEAPENGLTDPFGAIDLEGLDLVSRLPEATSGAAAAGPEVAEPPAMPEIEDDWAAELEDLVMEEAPSLNGAATNGAATNGAAGNGAASNGAATTDLLDLDDFSDLDALLGDEGPIPSAPPVPSPPPAPSTDEDSFDDLEKLLGEADQLGGSAPSVGVRRGAGVASGRAPRRAAAATDQTMRVSVGHLDNLNNLMGELVVNRNSLEQDQEQLRQSLDNLLNQVQQLNDVGQRMRDLYERSLLESSLMANRQAFALGNSRSHSGGGSGGGSHATGATFDALEMDRFTGFHTLSQEMIELIVRVREASSDIEMTIDSTDQIARQFRQVTTQLQEGLNKARMVPFGQTAERLPRAVRDISIKCGKEAKLVVEGQDTLIDKMILERLYDPMTHLVNNAITHGVETPEERLAVGKSREGTITVRAFYQGNQTVIYIADNGGGINPTVVKAKAIKKGLITPAEAQSMSDLEVYDLLFEPGFSTRDQADDFSGRGVGMDVVRTALSEIRGSITIESEVGKGTSFTIRLPLTLSITKALSCINNQARIAFPMDGVEDMFDVPKERVQTDEQGHSSILWRDTLLPVRPLSDLLKFNRSLGRGRVYGGSHDENMTSIVVLRSASSFIGLQVDQVISEQEIVIKQLEGPVPKPTGIAGATVLGDGRVMPIADVLELIDMATGRVRREAPASLWAQPVDEEPLDDTTHTEPTVLIVDDSITVRELLSMSFNKVGYRVEQARDGQEAWEKLRSGLPCDLVFCDIEMPRMDGLELLSRLQSDETLSHLPIAMLTSRGADRHRQMAVDLGAKGYFTKPYLEEMLLDAAQRMLKGENMISLKEKEE